MRAALAGIAVLLVLLLACEALAALVLGRALVELLHLAAALYAS